MELKEAVATLGRCRLVSDESEVASFECALEALAGIASEEVVRELHLVFDDAARHREVVFGLIHLLESLDMGVQIRAFVRAAPDMEKHASEWTRILLFRLLNEPAARGCLVEALRHGDVNALEVFKVILGEIASSEKPPLSLHAGSVLVSLEKI